MDESSIVCPFLNLHHLLLTLHTECTIWIFIKSYIPLQNTLYLGKTARKIETIIQSNMEAFVFERISNKQKWTFSIQIKKVISLPLCHCFHFENGVQFEFNAEIKLRNFLSEKERANKACCFSQFNFLRFPRDQIPKCRLRNVFL